MSVPTDLCYDLETMPTKQIEKITISSFLVHELSITNRGLNKNSIIYTIEEIANRPGFIRVNQYCSVQSEDEARSKYKRMISLKAYLLLTDRKQAPVGNLDEINKKAKVLDLDNIEAVSEEDDDDDDESQEDNDIETVAGEIN